MGERPDSPSRKISQESTGKNFLNNIFPLRRSVIETGSTKIHVPPKLNRSFMAGTITLQNSRPPSSVCVIDETKELEDEQIQQKELEKAQEIDRGRRREKKTSREENRDNASMKELENEGLKKGDLGSGRFEKRTGSVVTTMPKRKTSSQEKSNSLQVHGNGGGIVNQGYVHEKTPGGPLDVDNQGYAGSRQPSIHGGASTTSLPVYREQYCCFSRWSRLEKILMMIIFILCFIIVCLVSVVGFLSKNQKIEMNTRNCDAYPLLLRPMCSLKA